MNNCRGPSASGLAAVVCALVGPIVLLSLNVAWVIVPTTCPRTSIIPRAKYNCDIVNQPPSRMGYCVVDLN